MCTVHLIVLCESGQERRLSGRVLAKQAQALGMKLSTTKMNKYIKFCLALPVLSPPSGQQDSEPSWMNGSLVMSQEM